MTIDWWILVYQLIGGLALFLFGMDVMTRALKASAGNQLKFFLKKMTSTRWKALMAGTGITAVIQSSSVTTVLAVGFVSAGLMSFKSTLGLILGADIGTTITAQIIAFKVTKIALLLVIIGYLFILISKRNRYHEYGKIIIGLGLIFLGMNLMSEGMHPLKTYPPFIDMMLNLSNPVLGILVGTLFTALIQSSSATTGVVIVLAAQGLIAIDGGISVIIGANIGTCVTAFLSAIGKPKAAMQVATAHILFKLIGAFIWVWFIPQLAAITQNITPNDLPRQIANAHTIFNVASAALLIGFTSPIARLIMRIIPVRANLLKDEFNLLDKYYLQHPGTAIDLVDKEIMKLADKTSYILKQGMPVVLAGSLTDLEELRMSDISVDFHHKQILAYLQQLQQEQLNKEESGQIKRQMELSNILEAAADIVTTDMTEAAEHRIEHNFYISDATYRNLEELYYQCTKAVNNAIVAYSNSNSELAHNVLAGKKAFKKNQAELKDYLITRLSKKDPNRIAIIRMETELIELSGRLHSLARRIARIQLD